MKVSQIMKHAVRCCDPNDSLEIAARLMWENDCGCVPVRDSDGRVIGMITDRDVCMAALFQGGTLRSLKVSSAMAKQVLTCGLDDTIATAEAIMREHQVRRLPVVDGDGHLAGIISLNDIALEAGHEAGRRRKKEVSFAEVGETLQGVCKPRSVTTHAA
jgi:CBS domain-containing protein